MMNRTGDKMRKSSKDGATLVELIVTLVIIAVIGALAAGMFVTTVRSFMQTREQAHAAEKAQLAMNRVLRELLMVTNMVSGTSQAVVFDTLNSAGYPVNHTIAWSGTQSDPLLVDANTLTDDVNLFRLDYIRFDPAGAEIVDTAWSTNCRAVDVVLHLGGTGPTRYTGRVYPRNLALNAFTGGH
ncbi:MAG: type II secretion system protein [Lentisphaerales bacterium]|nr:MAG: type II secretion system protein [Lentisphaerales bacterium]